MHNRLRAIFSNYPRQFILMFWGMLISTTGASMIWPFLMIYVKGRVNLPLTVVASLFTVNAIAGLISALIAGPIIDRLGRKWVMVISLTGNGFIYLLLSQASTIYHFILLMALSGMFNPLYRVGGDAMLADLIPPEKRPDAYAMLRLSNNVGVAIGPAIGGLLTTLSYTVAFLGAAIGFVVYSLILAFLAVETIPMKAQMTETPHEPFGGYLRVLSDRNFISFIIVFTLIQMCSVLIWVLMPVYANNIFHVPERLYGLIPTTNALMVVFFQILVTRITKRYPPLWVMILGSLFYTLAVGSVALGHSFWGFWTCIVIMTTGELLLMPTSSTYVAGLAPADMRGRYMSLYGLTWAVATGIAPLVGGYLSDNLAPVSTWYGGFIIGILALAGLFLLISRKNRTQTIFNGIPGDG